MAAYAIAHLRNPDPHPDVIDYLRRIQATLDPYLGRFLVHGGAVEVREGTLPGDVVVIEFPGIEQARAWYESAAYQEILPLRTDHIESTAVLVEGVGPDHSAARLGETLGEVAE
ncbi:DUF1330 domain-containing protein [Frankia sp. QA3]|uniref:DUF1330 domain-containing protein n=1 Tax=Frankia sp. QA3 TaxID=710111 RepID=UPI000269C742|nr:DUF1330 domain-containing protein [Frankia sp. QA3]EIV94842.1 hypothetical protein FraQA3DRAFT_4627 [Frankia sp. QA3]